MTDGDEKYKLGELTADMASVKRVGVIVGFIIDARRDKSDQITSAKDPRCEG